MHQATFAAIASSLLIFYLWIRPRKPKNTPPVVHIPNEAIFRYPREAYAKALKEHGSVIGVYRKNRLEYIVDHSHALAVLTNENLFSAEQGTAAILNMHFLNVLPYSFIGSLDRLVNKGVTPIMENLIPKLGPVFQRYMFQLADLAENSDEPVPIELADTVHKAMAESMLLLIIGEKNPSPEFIRAAIKVAFDVAIVAGIYQNIGYWSTKFPTAWRLYTWIRLMAFSIPWTFRHIGWYVWKNLKKARVTGNTNHIDPDCLVSQLIKENGRIPSFTESIWIVSLTLGIVFASIHQTSTVIVWVLYELAVRKDYIPVIREELTRIIETDPVSGEPTLTYASLRSAERLDSFIREVMRTKGDTIAIFRLTTKDVPLGGYIIPKGSLITPLATLSHENTQTWGEDADKFDGERWIGTGKTASSISTGYWPFGLGRFACPGRVLAIAEIKLMIFSLIARVDLFLEGGAYEVVDPLNTVAVPPRGRLFFQRLDKYLL